MRLLDKSLGFWARKLLHLIINGVIAIAVFFVPPVAIRPATAWAFVLILLFESVRLKTRYKQYVHDAMGPLFKAEESLDYSGLFWASIGALVISLFADPRAYSYGFAILAMSDASAAIVGKWIRQKPFYMEKTFAGSTACFIVTFVLSFLYASLFAIPLSPLLFGGVMAALITFLEVYSYPFDDNFLILVVAAYGFQLAAFWT